MAEQIILTGENSTQSSVSVPHIDPALLSSCIHCGLCLPACPTYLASGRETESPRGRIYLLTQWNDGKLPFNDELTEHIDSCLGCLGCQTACPSGVNYEEIINQARPFLAAKRSGPQRFLMRTVFAKVLPNYFLLRLNGFLLRIWQALGIDRALADIAEKNASKIHRNHDDLHPAFEDAPHLIPASKNIFLKFAQWNAFLPRVPAFKKLPAFDARPDAPNGKIQLFSGCMMDIFYNHVNRDAMALLKAQGRMVENPPQTCCGALAFHAGEVDIASDLARQNIELFAKTDGPIAVTAAGCGAMMKEYGHLLKDDQQWSDRAHDFSKRVVDITEALAAGKFIVPEKLETPPIKIAYHAACHLAHAQSVRKAPDELLQLLSRLSTDTVGKVPGVGGGGNDQAAVTLVPLKDAEQCCGSAGIYNLLHPEMALAVLDNKMDNVEKTAADVVVSTNPGCLLQLEAGVRRRGLKMKIKHLCEVLADYYVVR